MLSLLLILYVIVIIITLWKCQKRKVRCTKLLVWVFIVLLFLIFTWFAMFKVVKQNDTGYFQQRIDTLTEVNKQMENWIEIIEDELSDNPELLNYVKEHLNGEINSNDEEISGCIRLQDDRTYRWWIYFR